MGKKIAILMFGLTRSLSKTVKSFKKHIYKPLQDNSIEYDIFIHTYRIHGSYKNMWSKESTKNYQNEDVESILHPKYSIFDNQEEIIKSIDFNAYYTKLGNWSGGFSKDLTKYLIKNMCLALYSKKQITTLFELHKDEYTHAIIMRPDMLFSSSIRISMFDRVDTNTILIPTCEWYGGCNDRMCIGVPDVIIYYGKLFDELQSYSERKSIISERYLLDKLQEKKLTILTAAIEYIMVRYVDPPRPTTVEPPRPPIVEPPRPTTVEPPRPPIVEPPRPPIVEPPRPPIVEPPRNRRRISRALPKFFISR